jgi:hypothetical protein
MSQHEQLDVLTQPAAAVADQQPQHSREGEIGERKEHAPMLPSRATERSGSRNVGLLAELTSCEAQRDLVFARAREPLNQRNPLKQRNRRRGPPDRHFETPHPDSRMFATSVEPASPASRTKRLNRSQRSPPPALLRDDHEAVISAQRASDPRQLVARRKQKSSRLPLGRFVDAPREGDHLSAAAPSALAGDLEHRADPGRTDRRPRASRAAPAANQP